MSDARALAEQLHLDQVRASRALVAVMLNELPAMVRSRVYQAVHDGTRYVDLRTRIGRDGARACAERWDRGALAGEDSQ